MSLFALPLENECTKNEFFHDSFLMDWFPPSKSEEYIEISAINFDLSTLSQWTIPFKTKTVKISADSVYISSPINITYKLIIRSRVSVLDQPIRMIMKKSSISKNPEHFAPYKQHIDIKGNFYWRQRKNGLIDILDVVPVNLKSYQKKKAVCQYAVKDYDEDNTIKEWFQQTFLEVMFMCSIYLKYKANKETNQR